MYARPGAADGAGVRNRCYYVSYNVLFCKKTELQLPNFTSEIVLRHSHPPGNLLSADYSLRFIKVCNHT
jgi:hypothetical protein